MCQSLCKQCKAWNISKRKFSLFWYFLKTLKKKFSSWPYMLTLYVFYGFSFIFGSHQIVISNHFRHFMMVVYIHLPKFLSCFNKFVSFLQGLKKQKRNLWHKIYVLHAINQFQWWRNRFQWWRNRFQWWSNQLLYPFLKEVGYLIFQTWTLVQIIIINSKSQISLWAPTYYVQSVLG